MMVKKMKKVCSLIVGILLVALISVKVSAEEEQFVDPNTTEATTNDVIDISPAYSPTRVTAKVGESGRIQILPIHGIEVTGGSFAFYTNEKTDAVISVHEDGSWEAVGSGVVQVGIYYEYSQETIQKFEELFPGADLIRNLLANFIAFDITNEDGSYDFAPFEIDGSEHLQSHGWRTIRDMGKIFLGTTGESRRLEAYSINLEQITGAGMIPLSGGIEYRSHIQSLGWENTKRNGEISGTTGQARRIEAVQFILTGELAQKYDIQYRAHVQGLGWLPYVKNGETAGTTGQARRLEAIDIVLIQK